MQKCATGRYNFNLFLINIPAMFKSRRKLNGLTMINCRFSFLKTILRKKSSLKKKDFLLN